MLRIDVTAAVKRGPAPVASSARSAARTSAGRAPYALYVRVRPWTARDVRHPGRPRAADLRRVRAAHLRGRQPAHRLSARLSVPDVAPPRRACRPTPTSCCACAAAAGSRASRSATGEPDRGVPLVSAFRWDTGVQVHAADGHGRAPRRRSRPARWQPARSATTTAASSSPARRAASGRRAGRRRLGRARAVPQRARRARARRQRDGRQTAIHADRVGRRRRVLARLLSRSASKRSSATGAAARQPPAIAAAAATRSSTSVEGRYKLRPGLYVAGRFDHLGFSDVTGTTRTLHVGRAGDARRSRRRATRSSAICC